MISWGSFGYPSLFLAGAAKIPGSWHDSEGCRQQVLFYWALKALNTEWAGEGADVDTLAFESGCIREIT